MKLTQSQLKTIIREEYVKVLFEAKGRKLTTEQVKVLAENLDEGLFGDILKSVKAASAAGAEAFASSRKASKEEDIAKQEEKNEAAAVKTQLQLKEKMVGIQQSSKDMLKSNGFVGEDNDVAVLGIDLFRSAVQEVMKSTEVQDVAKPSGGRDMSMGRFVKRSA